MELVLFLLLAISLPSNSHAESSFFNPIQILRPGSEASGRRAEGLDCLSWRLAVETNNRRGWEVVPQSCKDYIEDYMQNGQYRRDCEEVAADAIEYAKNVPLPRDTRTNIWVFDIDETTLSNLAYYARPDVQYGTLPYNREEFRKWIKEGKADAVPGMLNLHKTVRSLGFKTFFITAMSEEYKEVMAETLKKVGYEFEWSELLFRGENEEGPVKSTKRTELVRKGYRIIGNVGDQWSDLLGANAGRRTFKVPNPMYYVALPPQ